MADSRTRERGGLNVKSNNRVLQFAPGEATEGF